MNNLTLRRLFLILYDYYWRKISGLFLLKGWKPALISAKTPAGLKQFSWHRLVFFCTFSRSTLEFKLPLAYICSNKIIAFLKFVCTAITTRWLFFFSFTAYFVLQFSSSMLNPTTFCWVLTLLQGSTMFWLILSYGSCISPPEAHHSSCFHSFFFKEKQ